MTKLVKKEIQKTGLFVLGGCVLAGLGYFQTGTNQKALITMGITFAVIGLASILIYLILGNKPEYQANIRAEREERSVFIRRKAGALAFWLTFAGILVTGHLDYFGNMTASDYMIYVGIYMTVVYFGCVMYFLKKH